VLAIKLIMENREHWIRNSSGYFGRDRFENPFGFGGGDGTPDTGLFYGLGHGVDQARRTIAALLGTEQ